MTNKKTASLLALTMLAVAFAPATSADLTGWNKSELAQGPAGVLVKCGPTPVPDPTDPGNPLATFCPQNRINTAVAFCQLIDAGVPTSCDASPGDIAGLGGAFFNLDGTELDKSGNTIDWNAEAGSTDSYGRYVDIWAAQLDGQVAGGYAAVACTDFNDDIECDSYSVGYADDDCVDKKDKKDCLDPRDLQFPFCAEKDDVWFLDDSVPPVLTHDRFYDDFVVFIEWWIDQDSRNDPGDSGSSTGTFEVKAKWGNFLDKSACQAVNTQLGNDGVPIGQVYEHACADNFDNDGDGLTDTLDPGCDGAYDPDNSEAEA